MKKSKPTMNGPIMRKIKMVYLLNLKKKIQYQEALDENEEKMFEDEEAKGNGKNLQIEMPREEAFDGFEEDEGKAATEPENETFEEVIFFREFL